MEAWICVTCGTQHSPSAAPSDGCAICLDERQYVGHRGQHWTTLSRMREQGHRNAFDEHEPGLVGIGTVPGFAIGQRALLLRTPEGNLLWDCISYLDDITVELVRALGGVRAISISHPHYYSSMVEWAERLDAKILLHEADRRWVMRPDPHVEFWSGDRKPLFGGITLLCLGGHFEGGTVAHWPAGASGKGALLSGDIVQVVADRTKVTFMYSYPNQIPLPAAQVRSMREVLEPLPFDRIYGAWWDRVVPEGGKEAVLTSADRYVRMIAGR